MNMCRRILAAALVIVIAAAFFGTALAQSKSSGGVARLYIAEMRVRLGERMEGQDFEHTYVVKNIGDAELQIFSVRPG